MTATRNDAMRMPAPVVMRFPLRFARRHETLDRNYYTVRNLAYSSCSGEAGNRGREQGEHAVNAQNAGCGEVAYLRNLAGKEINPNKLGCELYNNFDPGSHGVGQNGG